MYIGQCACFTMLFSLWYDDLHLLHKVQFIIEVDIAIIRVVLHLFGPTPTGSSSHGPSTSTLESPPLPSPQTGVDNLTDLEVPQPTAGQWTNGYFESSLKTNYPMTDT